MRISDWSSDVCSSDLCGVALPTTAPAAPRSEAESRYLCPSVVSPLSATNRSPLPTSRESKVTPFAAKSADAGPPDAAAISARTEESRVGQECVSTSRSQGRQYPSETKNKKVKTATKHIQ